MKYFTIDEFLRSSVALLHDIDNSIDTGSLKNLEALVENVLDPLREAWGKPIRVTSGYRCARLNKAVGGVPTSHHLTGKAADITAGSNEDNRQLFLLAQQLRLPFCQLIDESGYSWLHVSYDKDNTKRQVLHL